MSQPPPEVPKKAAVLLVDDYPDAAEAMAEVLALSGYRVSIANDGETALALALELAPRVAVVDLGLPRMTGLELAERLKAHHGDDLTLIAVTGFSTAMHREQATLAGFAHFLIKPVDVYHLAKLLDAIERGTAAR